MLDFIYQGIEYNSFSRDSKYYFRSVLNHCWIAESPQVGVLTPLLCSAPVGFQLLQALVNSICFPSQARKCACAAKVLGFLERGGQGACFLISHFSLQLAGGVEQSPKFCVFTSYSVPLTYETASDLLDQADVS